MKKGMFISLIMGCLILVSCNNQQNVDNLEVKKLPITDSRTEFVWSFSNTEQDALAYCFSEMLLSDFGRDFMCELKNYLSACTEDYVPNTYFNYDNESGVVCQGYSLFSATKNYNISDVLIENSLFEFNKLLCYANDNYLRLHVYVPSGRKSFEAFTSEHAIYVVNALYKDALMVEDECVYYSSYVIKDNVLEHSKVKIDEEFAREHCVLVLSFREFIENWRHFSKGKQSLSNSILCYFVDLFGYGISTKENLCEALEKHYASTYKQSIYFDSTRGVKSASKDPLSPCVPTSDHFCFEEPAPEPPTPIPYPTELSECIWKKYFEYCDIYSNVIFLINPADKLQHLVVTNNILNLDLDGYDFPLGESTIQCCGHVVYIPKQICHYSTISNALEYIAYVE